MPHDESRSNRDSPSIPDSNGDAEESSLLLPDTLRETLKEPFGPVETEPTRVLEATRGPVIAVGDVVTYHLLRAASVPDVAVVDGRTNRGDVDPEVERAVGTDTTIEVVNPPGTITADLVEALSRGIEADGPVTVSVDGEEDLAALPAIVLAPNGASVVYGQPDEGMVHVRVDDAVRERVRTLLDRFEGDDAVRERLR